MRFKYRNRVSILTPTPTLNLTLKQYTYSTCLRAVTQRQADVIEIVSINRSYRQEFRSQHTDLTFNTLCTPANFSYGFTRKATRSAPSIFYLPPWLKLYNLEDRFKGCAF